MSKIIAIVGMPGAGKSLAAEFFRKKGIPVLRFGEITDTIIKEKGLELTPDNERKIREALRKELGMGAYAIKMEPRIKEATNQSSIVVLDGLYSWEEYTFLKEKFPQLVLLCIYARPEIRYKRLHERPIRPVPPEKSRERDIAELVNLNKGGPIALSDRLIVNEGEPMDLEKALEAFFTSL